MSLKSIGDLIDNYYQDKRSPSFSKASGDEIFDFIKLIQNWTNIVGPKMAKSSSPLRIKNKTLFIITKHPAYAQQLQFLEPEILEKIYTTYPILKANLKKLYFEASQHFETLIKENQEKVLHQTDGKEEKNPKEHKFNPEYLEIKSQAYAELDHVNDPELKKLMAEVIIQSRL